MPKPIAQNLLGTNDDGFLVHIASPISIRQSLDHGSAKGICQWVGQTNWGADITKDFCGEVVWAQDSFACNTLTNAAALQGKIALIRRGECSMAKKVEYAQQAGAVAAVILNHHEFPCDEPCSSSAYQDCLPIYISSLHDDQNTSVNIPAVFLERGTGEQISQALEQGEKVELCFLFPSMTKPTAASIFGVPMDQVDTMKHISVRYHNTSDTVQENIQFRASITNPFGVQVGELTYQMPVCSPDADSLVKFPPIFLPPTLGRFSVQYTNNHYFRHIDTLYQYFEHTENTYATDNGVILPGGIGDTLTYPDVFKCIPMAGSLVLTADNPSVASYATFGVANPQEVYELNPTEEVNIGVVLYDADLDNNGIGNLTSSFFDDLGDGLLAYEQYVLSENDQPDALIKVYLNDLNSGSPGVFLKPNHAYYLVVFYWKDPALDFNCLNFSVTKKVEYLWQEGLPVAPFSFVLLFPDGMPDVTMIARLHTEAFQPAKLDPGLTSVKKYPVIITPNPASDVLKVELPAELTGQALHFSLLHLESVKVALSLDLQVNQGESPSLNVKNLPPGAYLMRISGTFGFTVAPVVIVR
ncbi:MAG TPA: PA domain-containing protein [Saprospiraceae bacterium]|nr:PA domain-containing protein [Saprospiraceae bacterium]